MGISGVKQRAVMGVTNSFSDGNENVGIYHKKLTLSNLFVSTALSLWNFISLSHESFWGVRKTLILMPQLHFSSSKSRIHPQNTKKPNQSRFLHLYHSTNKFHTFNFKEGRHRERWGGKGDRNGRWWNGKQRLLSFLPPNDGNGRCDGRFCG